jgi:hypothetical protein
MNRKMYRPGYADGNLSHALPDVLAPHFARTSGLWYLSKMKISEAQAELLQILVREKEHAPVG